MLYTLFYASRPIEIPFGDRDQKCEHTFLVGDLVEFNIASDRRDKLQRATNIVLLEDTFAVNGENREKVNFEIFYSSNFVVLFFIGSMKCYSLLYKIAIVVGKVVF